MGVMLRENRGRKQDGAGKAFRPQWGSDNFEGEGEGAGGVRESLRWQCRLDSHGQLNLTFWGNDCVLEDTHVGQKWPGLVLLPCWVIRGREGGAAQEGHGLGLRAEVHAADDNSCRQQLTASSFLKGDPSSRLPGCYTSPFRFKKKRIRLCPLTEYQYDSTNMGERNHFCSCVQDIQPTAAHEAYHTHRKVV